MRLTTSRRAPRLFWRNERRSSRAGDRDNSQLRNSTTPKRAPKSQLPIGRWELEVGSTFGNWELRSWELCDHLSRSEELPRDIEPDIPVVVVVRSARDLPEGRPESVREVHLEQVASGTPLDAEARLARSAIVASQPRRDLGDEVPRRTDAEAAADAQHHGVLVVGRIVERVRVDHDDRFEVNRRIFVEVFREERADGGLIALLEVVGALNRRERVEAERRIVALVHEVVLAEELDAAIARAMHANLRAAHQAVPHFESYLSASVEAERVGQEIAEIPLTERPRESMGDAERPFSPRQPQRGWKRREIEVRLQRIDEGVGIRFRGGLRLDGGRRWRRVLRDQQGGTQHHQ